LAAFDGKTEEGGPSNLLIQKKTVRDVDAYEPGGRRFDKTRQRFAPSGEAAKPEGSKRPQGRFE
jgi:hypothetical protein